MQRRLSHFKLLIDLIREIYFDSLNCGRHVDPEKISRIKNVFLYLIIKSYICAIVSWRFSIMKCATMKKISSREGK